MGIQSNHISNNNIYTNCPLHNDSTPSFSFHLETGKWICFASCGSGNLEQLVSRIIGCNSLEAQRYLLSLSAADSERLTAILNEDFSEKVEVKEVLDTQDLIEGFCPDWFRERGFDERDISLWNIYYESSTGALIIPVGDGFLRRFPPGDSRRYKYSEGFSRKTNLFGLESITNSGKKVQQLLLVEGSLDAIWAVRYGIDAIAILGSFLSKSQLGLIDGLNPSEIVLGFDNDEAGYKASRQAYKLIGNSYFVSYLRIPKGRKDIQELSPELLIKAFNERQSVLSLRLRQIEPFGDN